MNFTTPVTFDSANRKKDRSVKLAFTTNFEVTNEDFAQMDRFVQASGWLGFKENQSITLDEMPKEDAPTEGGKTKLQRMRAVYFLIWRDHTDQSEDFNAYWNRQFEKLLEKLKERLD